MQDNKLNGDLEKFINDEITNSKIWVFCGIMISILLSQMLNLQAEMYKIMYIFNKKIARSLRLLQVGDELLFFIEKRIYP